MEPLGAESVASWFTVITEAEPMVGHLPEAVVLGGF